MKDREQVHLNNDVINKYQYSADMFQQYLNKRAYFSCLLRLDFGQLRSIFMLHTCLVYQITFDQKPYGKDILYSRNTFCSSVKSIIHLMFRCVSIKIIA